MTASFLREHEDLSRRHFLKVGVIVPTLIWPSASNAQNQEKHSEPKKKAKPDKAGARREPYFTPPEDFRDVSRGTPLPHSLSDEQKLKAGLTRDSWRLEIVSDPENPAKINRPMTVADGTALDFPSLMKLAEKQSTRFPKVMTCLNVGCPLGMGLWEGVPLRDVIWMAEPQENVRRIFYYGYHNDDPKQLFRSSLPVGRVLEDPVGLPPVILCYKLNGQWLDSERGGPVRIIVPEAYGFKSIKWLTHVVLTNLPHANDTYAQQNNDVDSPLKTFAATLTRPDQPQSGQPLAFSGYAQVGVSGLSKVQVSIEPSSKLRPAGDNRFEDAPWVDATMLPAPTRWHSLDDGKIPPRTFGFDDSGSPLQWPMPLCNAHWAHHFDGLPAGDYTFRCRSLDANGLAQPMPRPFRKSGHAAIESLTITVS
jgi:DMSO/TMAO reductase YedYZ molybdopterin-dependent catalytic subunit